MTDGRDHVAMGQRRSQGMGQLVDPDAAAGDQLRDRGGQGRRPLVEIGEGRRVHVVRGQVARRALGVRGEQVRRRLARHHHRHRAEQTGSRAVGAGLCGARRVGHRARPEQDEAGQALRVELLLDAVRPFAVHPRQVGELGYRSSLNGVHDVPLPPG